MTTATPTSTSGSERKTLGRTPTVHLGRLELISWLNRALNADYASVQECADGVAYCQLLDALHPGKVALHRLDFNARFLGDCERNVKTLRDAMRALDLQVDVDFDALASGKFIVRVYTCECVVCVDVVTSLARSKRAALSI